MSACVVQSIVSFARSRLIEAEEPFWKEQVAEVRPLVRNCASSPHSVTGLLVFANREATLKPPALRKDSRALPESRDDRSNLHCSARSTYEVKQPPPTASPAPLLHTPLMERFRFGAAMSTSPRSCIIDSLVLGATDARAVSLSKLYHPHISQLDDILSNGEARFLVSRQLVGGSSNWHLHRIVGEDAHGDTHGSTIDV